MLWRLYSPVWDAKASLFATSFSSPGMTTKVLKVYPLQQVLLLVRHAGNTSPVSPDGILVSCPNQLDWLFWQWRGCDSSQKLLPVGCAWQPMSPRRTPVHPVKEVPFHCLNLWSLLFVYSLQLMIVSQDMQTPADGRPIPLSLAHKRTQIPKHIHLGKGLLYFYSVYCKTE